MKKRLQVSLICTIIVGIMLSVMVFPLQREAHYSSDDSDLIKTVTMDQIQPKEEHIYEIPVNGDASQYLKVQLKDIVDNIAEVIVYLDMGKGYEAAEKYNLSISKGEQSGFVILDTDQYKAIRVEEDIQYSIDVIEFHGNAPIVETSFVKPFLPLVALSVLCMIFVLAFTYLIQRKIDLSAYIRRFICCITERRKRIVQIFIEIVACMAIALVLEAIISFAAKDADFFHGQRWIWICTTLLIGCIFICNRKHIEQKINGVVAMLILTLGSALILATPAAHETWDVESHYRWALIDSYLGRACLTQADLDIFRNYSETFTGDDRDENQVNEEILNRDYGYVVANDYEVVSLPHLPAGIAMALMRILGGSFVAIYKAGELANLLLYMLLCYFAIRKLRSGKMILAVIAMIPTNLMLATNYSYDYWAIGFSILGIAYYIGNCQETESCISTKDTVIMVAALAIACLPKQVYVPIMLIPFFMPRRKIENKKKYYALCSAGFIMLLLSFAIRAMGSVSGSGDVRGGAISPSGQIAYILANPMIFADQLFHFLRNFLSVTQVPEFTLDFAYWGMGTKMMDILTLLIVFTALTDKDVCDERAVSFSARIYAVLMYFGVNALIAVALYLSFTEVGATEIAGCQPRYIIPLLYPLVAMVGSGKIRNGIKKSWYQYGVLLVVTFITYINVYDVIIRNVI